MTQSIVSYIVVQLAKCKGFLGDNYCLSVRGQPAEDSIDLFAALAFHSAVAGVPNEILE